MPVSYDQQRDKFVARVTENGKRIYLGRFHTQAEAEYVEQERKANFLPHYDTLLLDEPHQSFFSRFLNLFRTKA